MCLPLRGGARLAHATVLQGGQDDGWRNPLVFTHTYLGVHRQLGQLCLLVLVALLLKVGVGGIGLRVSGSRQVKEGRMQLWYTCCALLLLLPHVGARPCCTHHHVAGKHADASQHRAS